MKDFTVSMMAVFRRDVRDVMRAAPPSITPTTPCGEAVRIMREFPSSCIIVTTDEDRPLGIITEHDVVHRIAFLRNPDTRVLEVMNSPVTTIKDKDYLFRGIALMHRFGLQHLPVVNYSGRLIGILHMNDTISGTISGMMDLIEHLTHEETLEGLKLVKDAEVLVGDALLKDRIPANEVQTLLTDINNDIYRRVQDIIINELREEGWGDPPVEFDTIIMGSGGRGESFLYPDQDYGIILTDYPDKKHSMVDTYFMEMTKRMGVTLDLLGIPTCPGYVMAANPGWRKSLSQWYVQINYWLQRPNHITLRYADIFFDFQHISGKEDLAVLLREHVTRVIRQNHVFLREMQLVQQEHNVALGIFGRLDPERDLQHKGKLNLKYRGILPLVEAIRLLALREGVDDTSTLGRIEALHASGILSYDEQDSLSAAFQILTTLILRQQINDYRKGLEVGPYVSPDSIPKREKGMLINSLQAIHALRERIRAEFTGNVF